MDKVTVIIPSYNHEAFIKESVMSVLNQDYKNIELIVIDDGSQDRSPEILKELAKNNHFQLIIKKNEGVCATLNRGIKLSTGDLITFIASDDYMPLTRISEQVEAFKQHFDADVIAGSVKVIDGVGTVLSTKLARSMGHQSLDEMFKKNTVFAPTAMFRKQVFLKYGMYREDYLFEDYYMWLRILTAGGKIFNMDKIWAFYRINTGNLEKRFSWYFKGYNQTLADYLPDPTARVAIDHYLLIYCAKMTFLKGQKFIEEGYDNLRKLKRHHRITLRVLAHVPSKLRQKILLYLMKEL